MATSLRTEAVSETPEALRTCIRGVMGSGLLVGRALEAAATDLFGCGDDVAKLQALLDGLREKTSQLALMPAAHGPRAVVSAIIAPCPPVHEWPLELRRFINYRSCARAHHSWLSAQEAWERRMIAAARELPIRDADGGLAVFRHAVTAGEMYPNVLDAAAAWIADGALTPELTIPSREG